MYSTNGTVFLTTTSYYSQAGSPLGAPTQEMPPDEDRDDTRIEQRLNLSGNRNFFFYYDSLIRRVSNRNERWPRRAATAVVIGFLIYVIYVIVFQVATPTSGTTRTENLAERLLGGKEVGMPNYDGWYPPNKSIVKADINTDVLSSAEGTSNAGLVMTAAEYAAAVGTGLQLPIWCDAATAIQYATRFTSPINKYKIYAMGIHASDKSDFLDFVSSLNSGKATPLSCDVFIHSQTPNLIHSSADAGWSIICNKAIRVFILSYESLNETHLILRWPSSHIRCLECTTNDLIISKKIIKIERCPMPVSADPTAVSCIANATDYISQWTGDVNWKDWHHGSRMRAGMLADAVQYVVSICLFILSIFYSYVQHKTATASLSWRN